LPQSIADAIVSSSQEVIDGTHDGDFVLDIFQTGSGTSTNMNANEVIANLAAEKSGESVHPNDHVNMSQSSNDIIPTATNVACVLEVTHELIPVLQKLVDSLNEKGKNWEKVYKNGRTHLMDATPVTLGQEFSGYASLIDERTKDIENSLNNVRKLAIGGQLLELVSMLQITLEKMFLMN
jgi:fumarate hydratase class II